MELEFKKDGGVLTVRAPKTIETTNFAEVEESLRKVINAQLGSDKLVIDLDDTTYVSSVGLRVILKLKKEHDSLELINASREVYEVFEMTGFTDIIKVSKAYRRISTEGCKVIGEGFYGRVYRLTPDTIVKVYFRGGDVKDVIRERTLAKTAFVLGVPTAISYDIVRVKEDGKDCYGSVFELLDCASMRDLMRDNPQDFDKLLKSYIDLLNIIHSTHVTSNDIPRNLDIVEKYFKRAETVLEPEYVAKLRKLVATIPDEDYMVHGDCHVKNILVLNGEPLLIDMDTLSKGNKIFEFISIYLCYVAYEITEPGNSMAFLGITREMADDIYNGIFEAEFGHKSEKEQAIIQEKIETLAYLLFLYRVVQYYNNDKPRLQLCLDKIHKGCDELKDLVI